MNKIQTNTLCIFANLLLFILFVPFKGLSQSKSIQRGITYEYQGEDDKTPLKDVYIIAGGASAQSNEYGNFKLEFKNLEIGNPVPADPSTCAQKEGYVVFNIDAIKQWCVTDRNNLFSIVLCEKSKFDSMVLTYYNASDELLKKQLYKERKAAEKYKGDADKYKRLLNEAEKRYDKAAKQAMEYAKLVARIDESELEGNLPSILKLSKEGRLTEAAELAKNDLSSNIIDKAIAQRDFDLEQERIWKEKAKEDSLIIDKAINDSKNRIRVLMLAGGKENFDLCGNEWEKIVKADSTNINNIFDCAYFYDEQQNYEKAEYYYRLCIRTIESISNTQTPYYAILANAHSNLGKSLFLQNKDMDMAEKEFNTSISIRRELISSERKSGDYLNLSRSLNASGLQNFLKGDYTETEKQFKESVETCKQLVQLGYNTYISGYVQSLVISSSYYLEIGNIDLSKSQCEEALEFSKKLVSQDSNKYNQDYAFCLTNLGYIYTTINENELAEKYLAEGLSIAQTLFEQNPDKYKMILALCLSYYSNYYFKVGEYELAEKYAKEAIEYYNLLDKNSVLRMPIIFPLGVLDLIYFYQGNYELTQECNLIILEHYRQLGSMNSNYDPLIANALKAIGLLYLYQSKYDLAELYFKEAFDKYSLLTVNDRSYSFDLLIILCEIAFVYHDQNKDELFIETLNEALTYVSDASIYLGENNMHITSSIKIITDALLDWGYSDMAEKYSLEVISTVRLLAQKNPDLFEKDLAESLGTYINILISQEKYSDAVMPLIESSELVKKLLEKDTNKYLPVLAATYEMISYIYALPNFINKDLSEQYMQEAANCYRQLVERNPKEHFFDLADNLHTISLYYEEKGDYDNAIKYLQESNKTISNIMKDLQYSEIDCLSYSYGVIFGIQYSNFGDYGAVVPGSKLQTSDFLEGFIPSIRKDSINMPFSIEFAESYLNRLMKRIKEINPNDSYEFNTEDFKNFELEKVSIAYGIILGDQYSNFIDSGAVVPDTTIEMNLELFIEGFSTSIQQEDDKLHISVDAANLFIQQFQKAIKYKDEKKTE